MSPCDPIRALVEQDRDVQRQVHETLRKMYGEWATQKRRIEELDGAIRRAVAVLTNGGDVPERCLSAIGILNEVLRDV